MAVNFGLLQPAQPVSAFFQGQQDVRAEADRNALRQMQAQQMAAQQENLLAQRQERMAHAAEAFAEYKDWSKEMRTNDAEEPAPAEPARNVPSAVEEDDVKPF